jgi:hypothetical protein
MQSKKTRKKNPGTTAKPQTVVNRNSATGKFTTGPASGKNQSTETKTTKQKKGGYPGPLIER